MRQMQLLAGSLSLRAEELGPVDRRRLREQLNVRFATSNSTGRLWEQLKDSTGVHNPEAWRYLAEFLGSKPAILFVDDEELMLEFPDGMATRDLLAASPPFECYVTNREGSFIICLNHHDYVIGSGSAQEWVASLPGTDSY